MASSEPSTSTQKPFNVAIIGGGIAGLTLAISLLQHSIPLILYESAPRFGEIGAGVAFGPNAATAMELISPKIKEAFDRCKTVNPSERCLDSWFSVRVGDARKADKEGFVRRAGSGGVKVGEILFEHTFQSSWSRGGVHRAHFLDEMVKLVPEDVSRFGKKLVDFEDAEDGSGDVVLRFADGTAAQHSAVIGCDGIKSRTREILLGKEDPAARAVFSGKYAYRGLIPMEKAIEILGEEKAKNSQMYFGYHGHLLTFPIEKGKTMNVVAFNSRETWDDPNWVVRTTKEEMLADYSSWGPQVLSIVSAMQKPDIWALFNHPPAPTYFKDRVCLLGDAAHATTPHQGAGAGMCIEDAYILSNLMKEASVVEDLHKVFEAYDQVRRPRTQRLVETSKEAGMLYDFELEGDDLDKVEANMLERMRWIWDVDLPGELEKAVRVYRNGVKAKL
ncbi:FAD/NAD(P)-binding domain-containing protein [Lindgomyces ingoldianus]|uniref:FAD/NAD(P)-binding domain-containing protein n=1 Tax=Lindgomyces ingoldianus TaxID=673940 RepID=A0ACB6QIV6_9PLEO|nr:FAD/NAD(P)-binding domain-containing protein [Lindgomyces ingoldianus]KAF2466523.1 FAD/NAD(P)-binding domain-containing protein [Lindgomyces ingoldianus]